MIELVRTVRTTWPVREVAEFLSDFRSTAEWDPHTAYCERADVGPLRVGSVFDNTQRFGPFRTTLRYTVQEYVPGELIRLHSSGRALSATDTMTFTADGEGTTVTYTAQFAFTFPLRLLEALLRPRLERLGDEGAAGMQRTLDSHHLVS